MDATHVGIGCRGNDRCLKVATNLFPDPGKSQRVTVYHLEVEGLTVVRPPFIEPAGWDKASVLAKCITEALEGVHGLTPGIEERSPT
jgi:hypothetical protein